MNDERLMAVEGDKRSGRGEREKNEGIRKSRRG